MKRWWTLRRSDHGPARWQQRLAVGLVLCLHAALLVDDARKNAPAFDEMIYAPAGYATWALGDQSLNPEHPPTMKLLLGATWLGAGIATHEFKPGVQPFVVGQGFLYDSQTSPRALLLRARLLVASLSMATALAVFLLARRLGGTSTGLIALVLYALDPLVVAHAGLATLDMGATALCFLTACALGWGLDRGWARLCGAGVLLGLALTAKLSTLPLLLGLLGTVVVAWREAQSGSRWPVVFKGLALAGLAALVVTLVCLPTGPHSLFQSIAYQTEHARQGHPSFAFGQYSTRGWWWYYPAAWVVKTPLPSLVLMLTGLAALVVVLRREPRLLVPQLLAAMGIVAFAMAGAPCIGLRNILPVVPILCVGGGLSGARLWAQGQHWRWLVPLLLLWLTTGTIAAHPSELSFINAAAGGASAGPDLLADSNIDWGIDLGRVGEVVNRQPLKRLYLAYFGSARPAAHGIPRYHWMPAYNFAPRLALDGPDPSGREWIAISATVLTGVYPPGPQAYAWLAGQRPTAHAGPSILLFDITGNSEAHKNLGLAALSSGYFAEAIPALNRSAELSPDDSITRRALVAAHLRLGQAATAMQVCDAMSPALRPQDLCDLAARLLRNPPR